MKSIEELQSIAKAAGAPFVDMGLAKDAVMRYVDVFQPELVLALLSDHIKMRAGHVSISKNTCCEQCLEASKISKEVLSMLSMRKSKE